MFYTDRINCPANVELRTETDSGYAIYEKSDVKLVISTTKYCLEIDQSRRATHILYLYAYTYNLKYIRMVEMYIEICGFE